MVQLKQLDDSISSIAQRFEQAKLEVIPFLRQITGRGEISWFHEPNIHPNYPADFAK